MRAERALRGAARVVPIALLALSPLLAIGSVRAVEGLKTRVLDWLPERSPELAALRWYYERFGTDEALVVSWPGATLEDRRLELVLKDLSTSRDASGHLLFRQAFTGRTALAFLEGVLRVQREEALRRLSGWLVGPDGATTAFVGLASEAGAADPALVEARAREAARTAGVPPEDVRLGGSLVDAPAVDRASSAGLGALGAASAAIGLLAALLLVRDRRSAAAIVVTAAFAASTTLAATWALGIRLDALGIMSPVLAFVLAVSGGMHLDRYLVESRRTASGASAVAGALRRSAWPIAMAHATNAIGFASLAVESTVPVKRFAFLATGTVLLVTFSLLVVWPALAVAWGAGGEAPAARASGRERRSAWVAGRKGPVLVAWALLLAASAPGLGRLHTAVGIGELLPPGHDLVRNYRWFEANLGAAIPVEVVLAFPSPSGGAEAFVERTRRVAATREAIAGIPGVGGTLAADTFLPPPPAGAGPAPRPPRGIVERLAYVRTDPGGAELWRISARVSAFRARDFGRLTEAIERVARERSPGARDVVVAGGVTMVARAQQRLLRDLATSAGVAVVTIAGLLSLGLRSARAGLLATVPSVVPMVVVFGALGWSGVAVDLGIAMTASAALGLAVDNTCHIVAAYLAERRSGRDAPTAVGAALSAAGGPTARSEALCVASLAVFAFADFLPVARFGWTMAVLLAVAAAADLLLLPALLAGPAGRWVEASRARLRGLAGTAAAANPDSGPPRSA